ncbi:hypothetical protein GUJ93_ZPchr0006g43655 [Zizania palustris]|uniref:hAT-like transposase RNase-H fold domain-containing protein n=1 Tax=Zizania palustris TaxID=103762 RepID=A0A8J5T172_ZIZPA|nr:hypothetical protein GUJ93_ZPchr0006g43655 [Zizania palustris]
MRLLRPILSPYLGIDNVDDGDESQIENSMFLHQRCACHIINLIVKEALNTLKPLIETFRSAISFLNSSNQRIAAYKSYCIATDYRPRKFQLDMEVRWNSTYLMLKHLLPHRAPFTTFIHTNYPRAEGDPYILNDEHWSIAKYLNFLECFMILQLHCLVFTILHLHLCFIFLLRLLYT